MIFVTVGFHFQGFDRLIQKMDEIAGKVNEEVIMQIGSTKYKPIHAKYFDFVDDDAEMTKLFLTARIIVAHAGAGTLMNAIRYNRPFIVVPRLKNFNEHVDDQQIELADAVSKSHGVVCIYNIADLENALQKISSSTISDSKKDMDLTHFLRTTVGEP